MSKENKFIYTIRIVYKSGYTHEFKVYYFNKTAVGWEWEAVEDFNHPVVLGMDNAESVWCIGKEVRNA